MGASKIAEYRRHRLVFFWLGGTRKWLEHKATCSACSGYVQRVNPLGLEDED